MKIKKTLSNQRELNELCITVKTLISKKEFEQCYKLIYHAMEQYPHAPEPHNLLGILLEKQGNHALGMRHFRAAWALDPTYRPANYNLYVYGTFCSNGRCTCAYDDDDCPKEKKTRYIVEYDDNKIGRIIRRK